MRRAWVPVVRVHDSGALSFITIGGWAMHGEYRRDEAEKRARWIRADLREQEQAFIRAQRVKR